MVGTAIGGLCVGALGNLLGREGVGLLTGRSIAQVTGPLEGLAVGLATGIAAWAALAGWPRARVVATALVAAALASAMIHLAGGTLLAGSLQSLERGLAGVQLNVEGIGILIGEPGLNRKALGWTTFLECEVFVLAIAAGLLAMRGRGTDPGR
jgi:hypothetical protein